MSQEQRPLSSLTPEPNSIREGTDCGRMSCSRGDRRRIMRQFMGMDRSHEMTHL